MNIRLLVLLSVLMVACSKVPERSFTVHDLLITPDALPSGWRLLTVDSEPIVHFGQESTADMDFYYSGDPETLTRGGLEISRFSSEGRAENAFTRQVRGDFREGSNTVTTPFYTPRELDFAPTEPDEYRFGCFGHAPGFIEPTTRCVYLARYQEFIVYFPLAIEYRGESIVTVDELQSLLEMVNHNASAHIGD